MQNLLNKVPSAEALSMRIILNEYEKYKEAMEI
jgi:hypothetical protein